MNLEERNDGVFTLIYLHFRAVSILSAVGSLVSPTSVL